jgi:transcription initiation factor TFIID TATA-box-binding protein
MSDRVSGGTNINDLTQGDFDKSRLDELEIDIVNLIGIVHFEDIPELRTLSDNLPNSEYNPEISPFVKYESKGTTFMIPRNGTVSIAGADDSDQIKEAFGDFITDLSSQGISIESTADDISICNIIATSEVKNERTLDLSLVSLELGAENTEYEPEQFPGVIYKSNIGVSISIFSTGKITILGARKYQELIEATEEITEKLNNI